MAFHILCNIKKNILLGDHTVVYQHLYPIGHHILKQLTVLNELIAKMQCPRCLKIT